MFYFFVKLEHWAYGAIFQGLAAVFLTHKCITKNLVVICTKPTDQNISTLLALSHCTRHRTNRGRSVTILVSL